LRWCYETNLNFKNHFEIVRKDNKWVNK
jgi:hypothetical protein